MPLLLSEPIKSIKFLTNMRSNKLAEYVANRVGSVIFGHRPKDSIPSKNCDILSRLLARIRSRLKSPQITRFLSCLENVWKIGMNSLRKACIELLSFLGARYMLHNVNGFTPSPLTCRKIPSHNLEPNLSLTVTSRVSSMQKHYNPE